MPSQPYSKRGRQYDLTRCNETSSFRLLITDGGAWTSSERQNGDTEPGVEDADVEHHAQNGAAASTVESDVAQLTIVEEDEDGYRVESRQQTEYTSHTAEHVRRDDDGTEEVCSIDAVRYAPSVYT